MMPILYNNMSLKLLTKVKEEALELLFPIKCAVCEKETGDPPSLKLRRARKNKLICTDCLKKLSPSLNFYCPLCEARTADGKLCFSCRLIISNTENKFYLDRLFYPFFYKDFKIQKVIKAFKYRFIKDMEIPLGRLMNSYLEKAKERIDLSGSILIPVPLHKRKYNQRGYNQSELIAGQISKSLNQSTQINLSARPSPQILEGSGFEIINDCLIKNKTTKDQAILENKERTKNIKGVFSCVKPEVIEGKNILLVDDIYTTGATMQECARILKEAGAKEITGLVIARG